MSYYAIDFGTSNSLINYISEAGEIIEIPMEKDSRVLRSLLYTPSQNSWYFGKEAIQEYINNDGEGRFFRSVKKFLPEPNYSGTIVHNKKLGIQDIISVFLSEMRKRANAHIGKNIEKVVMGRPALYSLNKQEDKLAQDRMETACKMAGFKEIHFCPEPVAAGLDFNDANKKENIILIADFGGGTSDFTLMRAHSGKYSQSDILGLSGIFKAGDAIDGSMMKTFIAPHLGSRFEYQIPGGNNILTFPRQLLSKICSPAHITHLKEKDTWEHLKHIQQFAKTPIHKKQLEQLFTVVECQLGFPIFDQIEKNKMAMGISESALYSYKYPGLEIQEQITKDEYHQAIAPTINEIFKSLDEVFKQSGLVADDVHKVCLTGGTSQLNLIRSTLAEKFGQEKMINYNIYQSVVNGLSHYAKNL